jgi:hypothetical protein
MVAVLCPLAFETGPVRGALRNAGLGSTNVHRTGPGGRSVDLAVRRVVLGVPRDQRAGCLLILAGVAGALAPCCRAPRVVGVRDATGNAWAAPVHGGAPGADPVEGVIVLGLDRPVCAVEEKRNWREASGASVVDTESHAFAAACTEVGCRWAIVRGVSDAHDEALPAEAAAWVDDDGRTRPARVAIGLVTHPGLIRPVIRLGRRSSAVMGLVGERVCGVIREYRDSARGGLA